MASNAMNLDVRIGLTVPDDVAMRCLIIVKMWLEDHPDMTVRIVREGDTVKTVEFWRIK